MPTITRRARPRSRRRDSSCVALTSPLLGSRTLNAEYPSLPSVPLRRISPVRPDVEAREELRAPGVPDAVHRPDAAVDLEVRGRPRGASPACRRPSRRPRAPRRSPRSRTGRSPGRRRRTASPSGRRSRSARRRRAARSSGSYRGHASYGRRMKRGPRRRLGPRAGGVLPRHLRPARAGGGPRGLGPQPRRRPRGGRLRGRRRSRRPAGRMVPARAPTARTSTAIERHVGGPRRGARIPGQRLTRGHENFRSERLPGQPRGHC